MKRRLKAPSPALVIALIALFVALGGTSYAAITLPKNSVGTKQLKKNAVTGRKIKNGAVTAAKINTSGLTVPNADTAATAGTASTANALQGFAANQLVRATTASLGTMSDPCSGSIGSGFQNFSSTTFTTAISKSITAPVAGVILVFGHVSSEIDTGSGTDYIRLLGRVTVDGAQSGPEGENTLFDNNASCGEGRTMALETAQAVTAGNHTVAVQIAKSAQTGGTSDAWIGNASVTTLFVPFGNAGTQGVLGAGHAASHSSASNR